MVCGYPFLFKKGADKKRNKYLKKTSLENVDN